MATGQAAGAMAALSAREGVDPEELLMSDVHLLLRDNGAMVPEESAELTVSGEGE